MTLWSGSFPIGARTGDGRVLNQLDLGRVRLGVLATLPLPLMMHSRPSQPVGTIEIVSFTMGEVTVSGRITDPELGRRFVAFLDHRPPMLDHYVAPDVTMTQSYIATSESPGRVRVGDTVMVGELRAVTLVLRPPWSSQRPIRVWNE